MGVITIISDEVGIAPCNNNFTASGNTGIYEIELDLGEETGVVTMDYDAYSVPDRFEIVYDGNVVADSKYVGDGISGDPPSYSGLIGTQTLDVYEYNGSGFEATGESRTITTDQDDIANGTTEPSEGAGTISFTKSTALPTNITIRVTGRSNTSWAIPFISCPFEQVEES